MRDVISLAAAWILLSTALAEGAWTCGSSDDRLGNRFYANNALLKDRSNNNFAPLRSTPAQGDANLHLSNALELLKKRPYIQSLVVARRDKILFEAYFNGMTESSSANVHSASKSIWGAAAGIAISKGILPSIDTPIKDLLPARYGRYFDEPSAPITLNALLTMSSCLNWEEDVTERNLKYVRNQDGRGRDWIAAILDRGTRPQHACTPGKTFGYSTGNSQLMAAVLQEALDRKNLGQSTCEFIQANLFDKIGIGADRWGVYDQGYFAGGHSLWLSPRELMKFGLLYLNDGKWNGTQIVPRDWVASSKTAQVKCHSPGCSISADSRITDGYGYYFWLGRIGDHRVTISWGYGGQMIYMFDDLDAVVVITTDTVRYSYEDDGSVPEKRVMAFIESVIKEEIIEAIK